MNEFEQNHFINFSSARNRLKVVQTIGGHSVVLEAEPLTDFTERSTVTSLNALLLSVLNVDSRLVLGTILRWSIGKEQVSALFADILCRYSLSLPELVTVRSDNGSQFVARMLREFLAEMKLNQEFTRLAPPSRTGT